MTNINFPRHTPIAGLYELYAPPLSGKTSLATGLAHQARANGHHALYIAFEDREDAIKSRLGNPQVPREITVYDARHVEGERAFPVIRHYLETRALAGLVICDDAPEYLTRENSPQRFALAELARERNVAIWLIHRSASSEAVAVATGTPPGVGEQENGRYGESVTSESANESTPTNNLPRGVVVKVVIPEISLKISDDFLSSH